MTGTLRNMPRYIRKTDAFGWQGADRPNGPWRSITPPQSGTPWQPGSPMDDLRQASADVSGVELEPGWRQETANKLSPAALSVWCRFCEVVEEHGPPRLGLAAALRAAADLVVPEEQEPSVLEMQMWARISQRQRTRSQLLAIAAELENQ